MASIICSHHIHNKYYFNYQVLTYLVDDEFGQDIVVQVVLPRPFLDLVQISKVSCWSCMSTAVSSSALFSLANPGISVTGSRS